MGDERLRAAESICSVSDDTRCQAIHRLIPDDGGITSATEEAGDVNCNPRTQHTARCPRPMAHAFTSRCQISGGWVHLQS